MRTASSLARLRNTLLAAIGLSSTAGCGGKVVFDAGTGGEGSTGVTSSHAVSSSTSAVSTGTGSSLCVGAQPVLVNGADTGYVRCADGAIDRRQALECDATVNLAACVGNEQAISCLHDSDCTASPNGHCVHSDNIDLGGGGCNCQYACSFDSECGSDSVCACAGVVTGLGYSQCIPASCQSPNTCPSGECGISSYNNGCNDVPQVSCRSAADICRSSTTCKEGQCAPAMPGKPYDCESQACAVGRPLLVQGIARQASCERRDDWHVASSQTESWQLRESRLAPVFANLDLGESTKSLDPQSRSRIAQHYLMQAALEHASIGSFARFSLQLLMLGAPPELLIETQRAGLDEIEHARLAYGLAHRYGGEMVGPGPLQEAVSAIDSDLSAIVRGLVLEGCVGETLGAFEAGAAGADALPDLAAIHRQISVDEERHAALAWRTLKWILERDASLGSVARKAFDDAVAHYAVDPRGLDASFPEHGVLGSKEIGSLRRQCLSEVVIPTAMALLGHSVPTHVAVG